MKINEIINEAIAPIAPIGKVAQQPASELDQAQQQAQSAQQPAQQVKQENKIIPIIHGLRKVAGGQPVNKTGNPGIDKLLFDVAALGGPPNKFDKAVSGLLGGTFDPTSTMKRTKFKTPRSGTDIAKGIPADEKTTLAPGVAQAKGLSTEIKNKVASFAELATQIKKVATLTSSPVTDPTTGQPKLDASGKQMMRTAAVANTTENTGIDNLLKSAGVVIQEEQPQQTPVTAQQAPVGNLDQAIASA